MESIDPSDHRKSKSIRTDCPARVNVTLNADGRYHFTKVELTHNHKAHFSDQLPEYRRPTEEQKNLVQQLAPIPNLDRRGIQAILHTQFPEHRLTLTQVSNMINTQKIITRESIDNIGGDMMAMVAMLMNKKQEDDRWTVHIEVDEDTNRFRQMFFMSPSQRDKAIRFGDVIINDVALVRNQYNAPLNLFVIIDHRNRTQIIACAIHTSETIKDHQWVLDILFAILPPCVDRVFVSDFDKALSHVMTSYGVWHILCLHHLSGNIAKNLATVLGVLFQPFLAAFWQVYYAPSPAAFEAKWAKLLDDYPRSRSYLEKVLEPTKERWGWAWILTNFTCGVKTTGRVECENRISKRFGNVKTSLFNLVKHLIERGDEQDEQEQLTVRKVCYMSMILAVPIVN